MLRPQAPFVLTVGVKPPWLVDPERADYSAEIPAVRHLAAQPLDLHPRVTFFVGENGSGKSTLIEALAVAAGFNAEGGGVRTRFGTRYTHSNLSQAMVLTRSQVPPLNGFFLRAESFYNVATAVEHDAMERVYERPLHEQSHGESFLALVLERFGPWGLYILDEPEAALSLTGQLALMRRLHHLVGSECQFVIATHSPILLGYPDSAIYEVGAEGIEEREYEETEQYRLTRQFLEDRDLFLHHLFAEEDEGVD